MRSPGLRIAFPVTVPNLRTSSQIADDLHLRNFVYCEHAAVQGARIVVNSHCCDQRLVSHCVAQHGCRAAQANPMVHVLAVKTFALEPFTQRHVRSVATYPSHVASDGLPPTVPPRHARSLLAVL